MRTNNLSAGFLARDAVKWFSGLLFRRVAAQLSEGGAFLHGEIIRLSNEKARLYRFILLCDNVVNKGLFAQITDRKPVVFSERRSLVGSRTKLGHTNFRQTSGVKPAVEGLTSAWPNRLNAATWLAPHRTLS
jgi:hypothetical protein